MILLHMFVVRAHANPYLNGTTTNNFTRRDQVGDEQRLFRQLRNDYERSVRPVNSGSNIVTVGLGITLVQIADLGAL
jgi:hypothetical protein